MLLVIKDAPRYGHSAIKDNPLLLTTRYYGHLAITDTPPLKMALNTDNPLLRTPLIRAFHDYGQPAITDNPPLPTSLIRTPRSFPQYRHTDTTDNPLHLHPAITRQPAITRMQLLLIFRYNEHSVITDTS